MPVLSGRKIGLAIGLEGVRGTGVAPQYGLPHIESDFKPRAEKIINDSSVGVLAAENDAHTVKQWAEGDVAVKFTPNGGGLLLLAGMGTVVSTQRGVTGIYDHVFNMSDDNEGKSLTIVRKEANANERFRMATLRKWEIEVVVGEYIKTSFSPISMPGVAAADTVTFATENEFTPKYAALRRAAATSGLDAATPIKARSFKLAIERVVEPDYVFGNNAPDNIFVHEYKVGGEIVLRYENRDQYNLYATDVKNALRLTLANTDVDLGGGVNPGLVVELPTITVDEWDLDQGKDAIVTQTLGFKGLFDLATARAIQATLTNTVSGYPAGA